MNRRPATRTWTWPHWLPQALECVNWSTLFGVLLNKSLYCMFPDPFLSHIAVMVKSLASETIATVGNGGKETLFTQYTATWVLSRLTSPILQLTQNLLNPPPILMPLAISERWNFTKLLLSRNYWDWTKMQLHSHVTWTYSTHTYAHTRSSMLFTTSPLGRFGIYWPASLHCTDLTLSKYTSRRLCLTCLSKEL